MTQSERREYLIQYLLKEDKKIFKHKMPADKTGQEQLLRSLMNVRLPKPISEDFLKIQDEFYKVYVLDDMLQLKHFARQLDIISEGYRAQSL